MKDIYLFYNDIRYLHISCEFCKLPHATIKCPQLFYTPDLFAIYFQYRYGMPEFKRGPRMKFNSLKSNYITNAGYKRFLASYKTQTSRGSIMSCGTAKNIFDFTLNNKEGLNKKGQSNQYLPLTKQLFQETKNNSNLGNQLTQPGSEQLVKWLECKFSVTRNLNKNDHNTHESNRVYYDNQPSSFREEPISRQELESDRSFELTPKSETIPFRDETIATSNLIDDFCEKVSSFKEKLSSINNLNSGTISHLDSNFQINNGKYRANIRRKSSRLRHKNNSFISKHNYGSIGTNTQTNTHNTQFQFLMDVVQKADEKKNLLLKKRIVINFERGCNFDNYFPHGNMDKVLAKSYEMKLNDWVDLKSLQCIILKDFKSTAFFNEETGKHQ